MSTFLKRASGALFLLTFLSACSWLPLPYSMDLKDKLGSSSSGSVGHQIEAGDAGNLDFSHPDDNGECIDFSDADIPVTVESARLHYNATVDYEGPALSGKVSAQLYVSDQQGNLWAGANKVGPKVTLVLSNADTRLAGTAVLNRDQVDGINDRYLCWGLRVSGNDVSAMETGTATIEYSVEQLRLDIRFSVV